MIQGIIWRGGEIKEGMQRSLEADDEEYLDQKSNPASRVYMKP